MSTPEQDLRRYLGEIRSKNFEQRITQGSILSALQSADAGQRAALVNAVRAGNPKAIGDIILRALKGTRDTEIAAEVDAYLSDPTLTVQQLLQDLGG